MDGGSGIVVTILQALPDGSAAVGLVTLLFVMLATGMIATRRELNDKNKQIDKLYEANGILLDANRDAIENDKTIIQLLEGMQRQASGDEGDPS